MKYLLDTNILSALIRRSDARIIEVFEERHQSCVTAATVASLMRCAPPLPANTREAVAMLTPAISATRLRVMVGRQRPYRLATGAI